MHGRYYRTERALRGVKSEFLDFFSAAKSFENSRIYNYGLHLQFLSRGQKPQKFGGGLIQCSRGLKKVLSTTSQSKNNKTLTN